MPKHKAAGKPNGKDTCFCGECECDTVEECRDPDKGCYCMGRCDIHSPRDDSALHANAQKELIPA